MSTESNSPSAPEPLHDYKARDGIEAYLNQATRYGTVLAVLGAEVLFSYEMPRGRVFLGVFDYSKPAPYRDLPCAYRSVSVASLPKKWQAAIHAQGGVLTPEEVAAPKPERMVIGVTKTFDAYRYERRVAAVPQWVRDLPCNAPVVQAS